MLPGTGQVEARESIDSGTISRDDVADALATVLKAGNTIGKTFEVTSGRTPIDEAIAAL